MTDRTNAERQRRFKERQRQAKEPVRAFLNHVLDAAEAAIEAKNSAAWHRRTSAAATRLLSLLDGPSGTTDDGAVARLVIYFGGEEAEGADDIVRQWLAERWAERQTAKTGTLVTTAPSAEAEQALQTLAWVEDLRAKGEWTSPVVNEGLRAATALIRERDAVITTEEYNDWLAAIGITAMQRYMTNGCSPLVPKDLTWF